MNKFVWKRLTYVAFSISLLVAPEGAMHAQDTSPALTIYNQNFAVVRQSIPLDLQPGMSHIHYADATAQIEPDSVILRDPSGRPLQIIEQNYRNDPVSQEMLLSLFVGKTINFMQGDRAIKGRVVRSGYVPGGNPVQPIIDVDGQLQFYLPGSPVFPALGDDTILKPALEWVLQSDREIHSKGELAYVTGGLTWHADYNIVIPPKGNVVDLIGWITMNNQCGKTFENATISLMAGDVNKVVRNDSYDRRARNYNQLVTLSASVEAPVVTEKKFDEFPLYTLEHSATLRDNETKQVEFVRAGGVQSQRLYVYDGFEYPTSYYDSSQLVADQSYGNDSNKKIWVMQEFKNSKENHLGIPLPAGRLRFYRQDADTGQLQFVGENEIDHTPTDETVRVYTGNAFDLVGERRRTDFHIDTSARWIDESFEIKLRNHGKTPITIRAVEHLYRWSNWEIRKKSGDFNKLDSRKIEFPVTVAPGGEEVVSYMVHYSW